MNAAGEKNFRPSHGAESEYGRIGERAPIADAASTGDGFFIAKQLEDALDYGLIFLAERIQDQR